MCVDCAYIIRCLVLSYIETLIPAVSHFLATICSSITVRVEYL